jgi:hypothetical protein
VKVYIFPADLGGCGYYRLIWPAQVLRRAGHNIHIVAPQERSALLQGVMKHNIMVDVQIPEDADVIVLQRVTHRYLVQAIKLMRDKGVAVVVDMDDDLTCIHPANPAFHMLHPSGPHSDHSWQHTLRACEAATLVTVSTPALLDRYAVHGRGRVLHNCVPKRYLDVPHTDSDVVGWPGSVHSHPTDLQVMGPAPAQLMQAGHKFSIVGSLDGVHNALGVPMNREIEATGVIKDIGAWPLGVTTLGIGVAPLADTRFNASKSWLKPIECAAVGVPVVMSPRAEYSRLNRMGIGWLAKNPKEWKTKLTELISNESARVELGERGRKVAAEWTIEDKAWVWYEAWMDALQFERDAGVDAA